MCIRDRTECFQERATWDWIDENCPQEVQAAFWNRVNRVWNCVDLDELSHVVDKLLGVKRAFTAADVVNMANPQNVALDVDLAFRVLLAGLSAETNEESIERREVYPIQQLIAFVQSEAADRHDDLLQIEWGYLSLLDRHSSQTRPVSLFNAMKKNPNWYVDLLKLVFRERGDETERPEPTPQEESRYRNAHDLLDTFATIPGTQEDGSIVGEELRQWTDRVRELATVANRIEVTDSYLGGLFSKCPRPARPTEGEEEGAATENAGEADEDNQERELTPEALHWPPVEVCRVMEQIGADDMFNGSAIGVHNSRGATWRNPLAGGSLERARAAHYRQLAAHHENDFPRLAATFRGMAENMQHNAVREDEESERMRLER